LLKIFLISLLINLYLFGETINIAIASNLTYVIDEIKREFRRVAPDINIRTTIGSSGKLATQIQNGAPYHIFMSADMRYPEILYKKGLTSIQPVIYAQGEIALISKKERDFSKGLKLLQDSSIRRIAVANPKTAPYGKASFEALKSDKILETLKSKLIFGESISQTLIYALRVADIGIVAKSSLYNPKMRGFKEGVNWITVDRNLYHLINQGIVVLKRGEKSLAVWNFYSFILGDRGREIFKKYGYIVPK